MAKPRRCVEKRREKKSLPPISTSALLRPLACGIRFGSYCLLKDTVVESGHIGVLTSWVSYIQGFLITLRGSYVHGRNMCVTKVLHYTDILKIDQCVMPYSNKLLKQG